MRGQWKAYSEGTPAEYQTAGRQCKCCAVGGGRVKMVAGPSRRVHRQWSSLCQVQVAALIFIAIRVVLVAELDLPRILCCISPQSSLVVNLPG